MTATVPQPSDTPATPRTCAPWCDPSEHHNDGDDATDICFNTLLRLDFGDRGPYEDAVVDATLSLQRHEGRTLVNLLGGFGMSLDPDQIRPMAMALLAVDATLNGDTVAAAFYTGEAQAGAVRA
ncbi:MAG TPA: hypothetical protein VN714_12785 [Trebonia sp.]|nr:hypothetical protein [Trebonia sp.]